MKRSFVILTIIIVLGAQSVFARPASEILPEPVLHENAAGESTTAYTLDLPEMDKSLSYLWTYDASGQTGKVEYHPSMTLAQAASGDAAPADATSGDDASGNAAVPVSIRNNKYFVESVRLNLLAQQSYDEGDYDGSTQYAEESIRYAHLSDEYVALQLKIKATDDAIAAARSRLDFATSVNAATRYPNEYSQAQAAYDQARSLRAAQSWDDAIAAANRVLAILANVGVEQPAQAAAAEPAAPGPLPLPAQYTVRSWAVAKDCLWNIAGRSYVYNDPKKWKVLYDANKPNMPQPNNPDLIHPGMVMNIPSIKGETRQGMWDSSKAYQPLP